MERVNPGGTGKGSRYSEDAKKNIREALAKVRSTEEYQTNHKAAMERYTISEEGKKAISAAQRCRVRSADDKLNHSLKNSKHIYEYDGQTYDSLLLACAAAGCEKNTFLYRCKSTKSKYSTYKQIPR